MSALRTILMLTLLLLTITVDASAQCFIDDKQHFGFNLESATTIELESKTELNDNDEQPQLTLQTTLYSSLSIQFSSAQIEFTSTNALKVIRAPPGQP